jgi:hypothetical protein
MNFLQLCQDLVSELGLAGSSGPSTVLNQTGELANVVRWIRDSALGIDNAWQNWKYLHTEYLGLIPVGTRTPTAPNVPTGVLVGMWDRDSIVINQGSVNAKPLHFEEWSTFRKVRQLGSAGFTSDEPSVFSIKPDGSLITYPTALTTYPIMGEFYRAPVPLAADNDIPLMPARFHRLIMCTAAVKYANREDAPEIIAGMEAEMVDLLEKLESSQLEGFEHVRQSTQDIVLEGAIPGME